MYMMIPSTAIFDDGRSTCIAQKLRLHYTRAIEINLFFYKKIQGLH